MKSRQLEIIKITTGGYISLAAAAAQQDKCAETINEERSYCLSFKLKVKLENESKAVARYVGRKYAITNQQNAARNNT